jgi:hypothetical protein
MFSRIDFFVVDSVYVILDPEIRVVAVPIVNFRYDRELSEPSKKDVSKINNLDFFFAIFAA